MATGLRPLLYAILSLEATHVFGISITVVAATLAWTVLLLVVLHGLAAGPLAA